MSEVFRAVKVSDRVWWVGAIDYQVRDFHGYMTSRGTTYNAYLIDAGEKILIDAVKAPFRDEMLSRVASVVGDLSSIRYVISNHSEMDHSGCLAEVIERVKPEKVFASEMGVKALQAHFDMPADITPVKDGETLELGGVHLTFAETRMLHWPDSMVTYLAEDKILFSQDGFGMHLATSARFVDELDWPVIEHEAAKYFANILLPFAPIVTKVLAKVAATGWDISIIAPDHGPIWRKDLGTILSLYAKWAEQKPTRKAVILFDTMWGSTARMATAIGEGLAGAGVEVKELAMRSNHRSDAAAEILDAGALLVGSPTINNQMFPTVADVLTYLRGLKPQNKVGAAFGSYGWSGEAGGQIAEILGAMKVTLLSDVQRCQYVPRDADLEACRALGETVAAGIGG